MLRRSTLVQGSIIALAAVVVIAFAYSVFSTPTSRPRPSVRTTDPYLGKSNADVTMVVFTDFECEFCKSEVAVLKEVLSQYQETVRFVHKDYPLFLHPNAQRAAEIGRCAQDQDRFWQMYDVLFNHQTELGSVTLETLAQEAQADPAALAACVERGDAKDRVAQSVADAQALGIEEVPTIFINDQQFTGLTEASTLRQAILEAQQ